MATYQSAAYAWLHDLKAGDNVIIRGRWDSNVRPVQRVTSTLVIVDGLRFRKADGSIQGVDHQRKYIIPATQSNVVELTDKADRKQAEADFARALQDKAQRQTYGYNLTVDQMRRITEILNESNETQQ